MQTLLREKEVLLREVHHRVKNNMQAISSLVSLQAETHGDPLVRELFDGVRDQVRTMALVHEKLYQTADFSAVEFAEYTRSLLQQLWRTYRAGDRVRLIAELEPL